MSLSKKDIEDELKRRGLDPETGLPLSPSVQSSVMNTSQVHPAVQQANVNTVYPLLEGFGAILFVAVVIKIFSKIKKKVSSNTELGLYRLWVVISSIWILIITLTFLNHLFGFICYFFLGSVPIILGLSLGWIIRGFRKSATSSDTKEGANNEL